MLSVIRTLLVVLLLASCANGQNSASQAIVVETIVASNDGEEVERLVTVPIERAIHSLTGFLRTESSTTPGSSRIVIFYASTPTPSEVKQIESAVLAEWAAFSSIASKPVVSVKSSAVP